MHGGITDTLVPALACRLSFGLKELLTLPPTGGFFVSMYDYLCRVTRVWDGDTFDGVVDLGFLLEIKGRFRLFGVNCPEMGTPEGVISYNYTRSKIEGENITIVLVNPKTVHAEKFGRWLVVAYCYGFNLNQDLRDRGLAVGVNSGGGDV